MRKFRFTLRALPGFASALALPALLVLASTSGIATPVPSDENDGLRLERQLTAVVQPFLKAYCISCHGKTSPAAQLDLTADTGMASVLRDDGAHWSRVLDKLAANQMPPSTAESQPSVSQRAAVIAWLRAVRQYEARQQRDTGDPGPVLARRLSNAEYDYTIRDLTGVDLRPTREFPVDPANQEGFDNSGESLTLSSALMKKYVQAAKDVADHMVLTSTGIEFATHPVLVETDRDKFCILRIVDFYKRQPTDYADYFDAAWRYRYRAALGIPQATLPSVAADLKVSPRYLALVWDTLTAARESVGPIPTLQAKWNALPAPDNNHPDTARAGCEAMRDWALALRKKLAWKFSNLPVPRGFSNGGQCFVLWKDRQYASHRRQLDPDGLQIGGVPMSREVRAKRKAKQPPPPVKVVTDPVDPDLFAPEDEAACAPYLASFERFCSVFPDAFYISERGRMFVDEPGDKGRLLTAGLHNSMGYFRDDVPLMDMILDDNERRKLDQLWQDFDMVAFVPERMHLEFFVYERAESGTMTDPEFNFARAEDKGSLSDAKIKLLAGLYLAKAKRNGGEPLALQAIDDHFKRVSVNIRTAERERLAAEPLHRKALVEFAEKAYRRPLTKAEQADLLAFYRELRQKDGLSHEDAVRDSIVRILLSPNFLFRTDLEASAQDVPEPAAGPGPVRLARLAPDIARMRRVNSSLPPANIGMTSLSDYALASRLSYFLWSSMPDKELLAHAAAGDLHRPEVLTAQTRRMLRDPRIRALALEFGGNWLDFRRFEEHNAVDRNRFPIFTNDLRESMFEEPVRFLVDTFQNDRSILNMLFGRYTFVNSDLARLYEMSDVKAPGNEWVRVENADRYGRGGLLPMAVFLTKNSPGLRTSPVKRGYWLVRRVLGEYIPPPPANVPELPKDESKSGDLTLREALVRHRQDPACAGCHARFDSYGLVFEGYDPIGQRRTRDLGGRPVDSSASFPGGVEYNSVSGLRTFISLQRQKDFVDTLDRKLLSFALERSLQPSDTPTLARMYQRLVIGDYRFGSLVETIVTSRQFCNRRTTAASASTSLARN